MAEKIYNDYYRLEKKYDILEEEFNKLREENDTLISLYHAAKSWETSLQAEDPGGPMLEDALDYFWEAFEKCKTVLEPKLRPPG